jgi:hypothetical protein
MRTRARVSLRNSGFESYCAARKFARSEVRRPPGPCGRRVSVHPGPNRPRSAPNNPDLGKFDCAARSTLQKTPSSVTSPCVTGDGLAEAGDAARRANADARRGAPSRVPGGAQIHHASPLGRGAARTRMMIQQRPRWTGAKSGGAVVRVMLVYGRLSHSPLARALAPGRRPPRRVARVLGGAGDGAGVPVAEHAHRRQRAHRLAACTHRCRRLAEHPPRLDDRPRSLTEPYPCALKRRATKVAARWPTSSAPGSSCTETSRPSKTCDASSKTCC